MPDEMLSAYLIAGTDTAKIDATRSRLRARAEREGGAAALETFEPVEGRGMPDADAVLASIPMMSLTQARRYLLVDGAERWRDSAQEAIAAAIADLPPDLTIVIIARGKTPGKLAAAVKAASGEVHEYEAAKARQLPGLLVAEAKRQGYRLDPAAARIMVDRMGSSQVRLEREVERLALWAGEGGEVGASDLEEMISDTSEAAVWTLADAVIARDPATAVATAERLISQGESVTGLIYALASRLRKAAVALGRIERGESPQQLERSLGMHPYAAKQLIARLGRTSPEELHEATEALADLEVWCRGGEEYGDELALILALRRAAGATQEAAVSGTAPVM